MANQTLRLEVDGMSCASCVGRVETALAEAIGVTDAAVNLATKSAQVTFDGDQTTAAQIAAIATKTGYPARPLRDQASQDARQNAEIALITKRFVVAACLTVPVVVLAMGAHIFPNLSDMLDGQASWLAQFVLTTVVLAWPGAAFFRNGVPALFKGAPDMNTLVAIGTFAAWSFSTVALIAPDILPPQSVGVYFEAAAVIVSLILLGHLLEARAKGRTGDAVRKLVGLRPKTAQVMRKGALVDLDIDAIAVGDMIHLRPGERVAVDGIVAEGASFIDESMLSGEPMPVSKAAGDPVTGGTVNGTGALVFETTQVGADTVLSQIIQMVQDAQGARLPIQGVVNKITRWFVPVVLLLAVLAVAGWLIFGAPSFALVAGVSVLIVACPCAMGLATPMSIMVGTGRAADLGVLFRKGDALQSLQGLRTVAFDKTGTLTMGQPEVTTFVTTPNFSADVVLSAATSIEGLSEHPIAQAVVAYGATKGFTPKQVQDFDSVTGLGAGGQVDGFTALIGGARFMAERGVDIDPLSGGAAAAAAEGHSVFYVALDGQIAGVMAVSDPIKPSAKPMIAAIHALGLDTALISGDTRTAAQAVATQLGIKTVVADVLPAQKVDAIMQLDGPVGFVGDGINDAPALARADVGIAIGTGTDVAIESADVVLMSGDLSGVAGAFEISRATLRNIRQNLFWAFAYNAALIPVAAGLLYPINGMMLSPMLAAAAMALSSVFVVTNALRLRHAG